MHNKNIYNENKKFLLRGNSSVCAGAFPLLCGRAPALLRGNIGYRRFEVTTILFKRHSLYQSTHPDVSKDLNLYQHRCENLRCVDEVQKLWFSLLHSINEYFLSVVKLKTASQWLVIGVHDTA
jgi:hypothetical protein